MAKKPYKAEFYGSDDVLIKLDELGVDIRPIISRAADESFKPVLNQLHAFTGEEHKFTGATEGAFVDGDFYKWSKRGTLLVRVGYNVRKGGEAAIFLQVGTPRMTPYHFITHAYHQNINQVIDTQSRIVNEELQRRMNK